MLQPTAWHHSPSTTTPLIMSSRPDNHTHQSRRRRSRSNSEPKDANFSSEPYRESSHKYSRRDDDHREPSKRADDVDRTRDGGSRRRDDSKREFRRSASPQDRHRDDRQSRHSRRHRSRSRSLTSDQRMSRRRRSRSRSPRRGKKRQSPSRTRSDSPVRRAKRPLPSQDESFRDHNTGEEQVQKKKPNFGNTGLLAKEANTVVGTNIVLKYHEPPEARKPPASQDWRLFIFKGKDLLETVPLSSQTCWLMGKEAAVADLVIEHPSTSKQHAVIQFRYIEKVINEFGDKKGKVKPYIIDLESSNGTKLNGEKISPRRFLEIKSGDVMKIGSSEREYVFILPSKD